MKLNKQHPLYQEDLDDILSISNIERLHGKSFLITGATGMVGVMLIDALMKLGDVKVFAVGRNRNKAKERLGEYFDNSNFEFIEQDVCMPFDEKLNVDVIIPAASNTHPLAYSQYPVETMMIYVSNTTNVGIATVEVYGNATNATDIFVESYTGNLNLATSRACYTESKRTAEALCQSYIAQKKVKVKIARLCRIFGPTMLDSDSKASSQFIKKAIAGEDIVLKSEGNQYFSYTYVADAVAGLLTILLNGENGEAYNISSEKTNVHLKEFAQMCAECNGKNVVFDLPSETEKKGFSIAMQAILSNEKIKSLGFVPMYEMKDAVNRTVEILK